MKKPPACLLYDTAKLLVIDERENRPRPLKESKAERERSRLSTASRLDVGSGRTEEWRQ